MAPPIFPHGNCLNLSLLEIFLSVLSVNAIKEWGKESQEKLLVISILFLPGERKREPVLLDADRQAPLSITIEWRCRIWPQAGKVSVWVPLPLTHLCSLGCLADKWLLTFGLFLRCADSVGHS